MARVFAALMQVMTITHRHQAGAPASQGGEFKARARSAGTVTLPAEWQRLADATINWTANNGTASEGVESFVPADIGSDLPAHFIDATEVGVEAGLDIDDAPESIDRVVEWFHDDQYKAQTDVPEEGEDGEKVQLKFSAYVGKGVMTRGDAVAAAEKTELRQFIADRESGEYEQKLAEYRAQQVTFDVHAAREEAKQYEGVVGLRQAWSDAENGIESGILLVLNNTAQEARRLSNSVTPHRFKHLNRLAQTGVANRAEALAEVDRATRLFIRFSRRHEAEAILAVGRWLQQAD